MDKGSKESKKIDKVVSRIKLRRRELKMTQTELANVANLTPAAISQFESGTRKPSFNTLSSLSDALKVTTDYLLGKEERRYDDLLADPKVSTMFKGMMEFTEKDKDTLYEFYEFLKTKAEASRAAAGKKTRSDTE
ncbi:MAG: helix-turn-helix domain-containing protein [Candidatus Poribacteria bacterium]|nr:helix-turn-helix domain-containing protein [Candidatus Poribacteria bacterium]